MASKNLPQGIKVVLHLKLRNINLHNVTHFLISRNLGERMFIVQISLFIVTFLSFIISYILSLMQTTKEFNPHLRIASCAQYVECLLLLH